MIRHQVPQDIFIGNTAAAPPTATPITTTDVALDNKRPDGSTWNQPVAAQAFDWLVLIFVLLSVASLASYLDRQARRFVAARTSAHHG